MTSDGPTVPGLTPIAAADVVSPFGPVAAAAPAGVSSFAPPGAANTVVAGNGGEAAAPGAVSVLSGAADSGASASLKQ